MVHLECGHYAGDEDCNKCTLRGIIRECDGCRDYTKNPCDSVTLHNKQDAYNYIDKLGAKHIADWIFNDDGTITIILNCRLEDIPNG